MLVLGPLGRDSSAYPCQPLPVSAQGIHIRSYKVTCSWWPPVVALEAPGSGYAVNRGLLPLEEVWGMLRLAAAYLGVVDFLRDFRKFCSAGPVQLLVWNSR